MLLDYYYEYFHSIWITNDCDYQYYTCLYYPLSCVGKESKMILKPHEVEVERNIFFFCKMY